MRSFQYLDHGRILEIESAFTEAGLVKNEVIDGLLANLYPAYVASLPGEGSPISRIKRILADLNRTERLIDGTVPLSVWLGDAVSYAGGKPGPLDVISRALADVSRRAAGTAPQPGFRDKLPGKSERIVGTNDLLPFDFLRRGAEAGRAVARLTVTRYDNGRPAVSNGILVRSLGTGWLLSPDLLITNHHVVNAREDGELDATADDLALQAKSIEVQFDYEAVGSSAPPHRVVALEAFAPFAGPLDYAILRLASAVDRKPLTITTAPLSLSSPDSYPSVNIIQHPQGNPKMVACRNNLVTRADGTQLWYFTDTMNGSSGSPVLDDRWVVVALHKKWDYLQGVTYQGRDAAWANQGTQMFAIVDHLRTSSRADLLKELGRACAGA